MTTVFQRCYQQALDHQGGEQALNDKLQKAKSPAQLKKIPDDRYLAAFSGPALCGAWCRQNGTVSKKFLMDSCPSG